MLQSFLALSYEILLSRIKVLLRFARLGECHLTSRHFGGVNNEVSASDRYSGSGPGFYRRQISNESFFGFSSLSHTSSHRRPGRKDNRAGGQGGPKQVLPRGRA